MKMAPLARTTAKHTPQFGIICIDGRLEPKFPRFICDRPFVSVHRTNELRATLKSSNDKQIDGSHFNHATE